MAPAQRRDVHLDVVFLDDDPGPHPLHQLVFADDFAPGRANTQRMSSARLPSRTSLLSRHNSRRARSSRNRPKLISPSTIGLIPIEKKLSFSTKEVNRRALYRPSLCWAGPTLSRIAAEGVNSPNR